MNSSHEKDLDNRADRASAAEAEAGTNSISELCRQKGISQNSFYKWRQQYGGVGIPEAKRLKELEAENQKLKKLVAQLSLDKLALEEVNSKKW